MLHAIGCHCDSCWRANLNDLCRKAAESRPDDYPVFNLFGVEEEDYVRQRMAVVAPDKLFGTRTAFGWRWHGDGRDPGDEDPAARLPRDPR